jgi:hypothetical protein
MYSWFQQQFGFVLLSISCQIVIFLRFCFQIIFCNSPLERNRWGLNTIGSGRKIEDLAVVFEIGKGTIL